MYSWDIYKSSIQLQSIKERTFSVLIWKVNLSRYVFYEHVLVTRPTVSRHSLCKIHYSNQVQMDFIEGWFFCNSGLKLQKMEGLVRMWTADRDLWAITILLGFMEVHLNAQQIFQIQLTKGTISYVIKMMSVITTLSQLELSLKLRMSEPAWL